MSGREIETWGFLDPYKKDQKPRKRVVYKGRKKDLEEIKYKKKLAKRRRTIKKVATFGTITTLGIISMMAINQNTRGGQGIFTPTSIAREFGEDVNTYEKYLEENEDLVNALTEEDIEKIIALEKAVNGYRNVSGLLDDREERQKYEEEIRENAYIMHRLSSHSMRIRFANEFNISDPNNISFRYETAFAGEKNATIRIVEADKELEERTGLTIKQIDALAGTREAIARNVLTFYDPNITYEMKEVIRDIAKFQGVKENILYGENNFDISEFVKYYDHFSKALFNGEFEVIGGKLNITYEKNRENIQNNGIDMDKE